MSFACPTLRVRSNRSAITLVETMVSLSVIAFMTALLLPAVQSAREAARRAQCSNNLKQLALAMHGYSEVHGMLPPPVTTSDLRFEKPWSGLLSIYTRMLPHLDQGPLYHSINFVVETGPPSAPGIHYVLPRDAQTLPIHSTAYLTRLAVLLCPSDGGVLEETGCNYRGNTGVGPFNSQWPEYPDSGNGLFPEMEIVRLARVRDGLSHTVAFSERLRGTGIQDDPDPSRNYFNLLSIPPTADALLLASRVAARPSNVNFHDGGRYWFWTGREWTLFNHAQEPNGQIPDGLPGSMVGAVGQATARSMHPGGVNAVMGDGSVRFVLDSIARPVWRGLGTRAGGELVD